MPKRTFTAYYRVGGTANFEWKKAFPVDTRDKAVKQVVELRTAGYPAEYHDTKTLNKVGLPKGYELSKRERYFAQHVK